MCVGVAASYLKDLARIVISMSYAVVHKFSQKQACTTTIPQLNTSTQQGNRRYQTSPALCTLITPSRPIGRIACAQNFPDSYLRLLGIGILNNPFC